MKYLNTKNVLLVTLLLVVFAISANLVSDWSFPDTDWKISKDSKAELKKEERPVLQKFVANRDGLSGIEMLLGSAKIDGFIKTKILDENCDKVLREGKLKESEFDSEKTYAFEFSKIDDSKSKTFCFSIHSDGEKTGSKNPSIFINETPAPNGGSLEVPFANKEEQNRSLAIRPAYRNLKWSENFTQINQRISQYKPFFLKDTYLLAITLSFIILSIVLIAIIIVL